MLGDAFKEEGFRARKWGFTKSYSTFFRFQGKALSVKVRVSVKVNKDKSITYRETGSYSDGEHQISFYEVLTRVKPNPDGEYYVALSRDFLIRRLGAFFQSTESKVLTQKIDREINRAMRRLKDELARDG